MIKAMNKKDWTCFLRLEKYLMKRGKIFLPRLTLSTALVMLLILSTGCQESPPKKAQIPTYPSLRESFDQDFHHDLETALKKEFRGEYERAVENKKVAFVVVDLNNLQQPRVAGVNPDVMMYAASLPKIAILLGAFVKIERGEMSLNDKTRVELIRMIRKSSNKDATTILNRVGFEDLAEILQSQKYRLYDSEQNGGLWVGRDYSGGPVWKRDPLHNISHGATAIQVARFYYLAMTGRLISKQYLD